MAYESAIDSLLEEPERYPGDWIPRGTLPQSIIEEIRDEEYRVEEIEAWNPRNTRNKGGFFFGYREPI